MITLESFSQRFAAFSTEAIVADVKLHQCPTGRDGRQTSGGIVSKTSEEGWEKEIVCDEQNRDSGLLAVLPLVC